MNVYIYAQRLQTRLLIKSEPTMISLVRKQRRVRSAAGGVVREAVSPEQVVQVPRARFLGMTTSPTRYNMGQEGQTLVADHVLVGTHDDDIQQGDEFSLGGNKYRVAWVGQDRTYETRAFVAYVGGGNG